MTEAVFDFAAINRRLNRKQEPETEPEGALANGGPVVGSPGSGPANVSVPWYSLQTDPKLLKKLYQAAAANQYNNLRNQGPIAFDAKQNCRNTFAALRAEVEQMEREIETQERKSACPI